MKYVDPTGLSDEDVKSFCLEDLVDILDTVVSGTSNILEDLGLSFSGISERTNERGSTVYIKTAYDYNKLETAEKLDDISKVFLGVAILVNVIDVCKVGIDNPDNPDVAMTQRFIRNATTLGLSYLAAGLGSKIGQCFGEFVGSKIGTMLGGAAGTAVAPGVGTAAGVTGGSLLGGAIGAGIFGTAGSFLAAYGTGKLCDYIFERKLGW